MSIPVNPGAILEFTYTGAPGPLMRTVPPAFEQTKTAIIVYPNPVNNLLTINSNGNFIRYYELISICGGIIERANITSTATHISVNKENPGIYIFSSFMAIKENCWM